MATEAWITIAATDLDPYLAAAGVDALQTAALAVGQADPFNEHMPSVVAIVRGYIKGCASNVLSATANSVPRSLKQITCLMIIEAMQGRLPGVVLTEGQQKMLERGVKMLEKIAECEIPVTQPTDPAADAAQTGPNAYLLSSTDLTTKRDQVAGL